MNSEQIKQGFMSVEQRNKFSLGNLSVFKNSNEISKISQSSQNQEESKSGEYKIEGESSEDDDMCNADIESSDDESQNRVNFQEYTEFKRDENNDFWIGGENLNEQI